jgi:hypothetical protein
LRKPGDDLEESLVEGDGPDEDFVPKTTPRRWLIIFFYLWNLMIMSAMSLSFSPISVPLMYAYDVSQLEVNGCCMCFTVTSIPTNFLAVIMYAKMPSHYVLRIGAALFFVGAWFRIGAVFNDVFWPVVVG